MADAEQARQGVGALEGEPDEAGIVVDTEARGPGVVPVTIMSCRRRRALRTMRISPSREVSMAPSSRPARASGWRVLA